MRGLLFLAVFLLTGFCYAQEVDSTLVHIENKIKHGNVDGISDLIANIDYDNNTKNRLLSKYLFLGEKDSKSVKDWKKTFTAEKPNLENAVLLQAYYKGEIGQVSKDISIQPLPRLEVSFEDWARTFKKHMLGKEDSKALFWAKHLEDYFALSIRKGLKNVVQQILLNQKIVEDKKVWQIIVEKLNEIPSVEHIEILATLYQRKLIDKVVYQDAFSSLLRMPFNAGAVVMHEDQMDIVAFHITTYESKYNIHRFFFEKDADFLVYVATKMDGDKRKLEQVISDLLLTHDPSVLYYLPVIIWRNKDILPVSFMEKTMQKVHLLAQEDILWQGQSFIKSIQSEKGRQEKLKAYVRYWAQHAQEFQYEIESGQFVNKNTWENDFQKYEKLFKRLNATADEVVLEAYNELAIGNPIQIAKLNEKYKDFLRQTNNIVPSLKYKLLPALSKLNALNKSYNFSHDLKAIQEQLSPLLSNNMTGFKRIELENEIIAKAQMLDIPTMEWMALINAANGPFNFSISRIVNHLYSAHWEAIKYDEKMLAYYVHKAEILSHTSLFGFCKNYMNVFLSDPSLKEVLQYVKSSNLDPNLDEYLRDVLVQIDEGTNLKAFKEAIHSGDNNSIRKHKINGSVDLYGEYCQGVTDKNQILNAIKYIKYHKDIKWVPTIMHWLATVEDEAVQKASLERLTKIYKHTPTDDPIKYWLAFWKKDKKNYTTWSDDFVLELYTKVTSNPTISINDFNTISMAPQILKQYDGEWQKLGVKLDDLSKLKYIKSEDCFDDAAVKELWPKIKKVEHHIDLLKHSRLENPLEILSFIVESIQENDLNVKGENFNKILERPIFINALINGTPDQILVDNLMESLDYYLEEGDYDVYSEQLILSQLFILENAQLSFEEFMTVYWQSKEEIDENNQLGELLFAQLTVENYIKIYDEVLKQDVALVRSINADFGFAINDYSRENLVKFKKQLASSDLKTVLKSELSKWPLDLWTGKDKPDFDAIYKALALDHVDTYVGTGGKYRDDYIFGLTQYLALHFEDDLGFSSKLSEGQTFFRYNANKRAKAWLIYLRDNRHVSVNQIFTLNKLLDTSK